MKTEKRRDLHADLEGLERFENGYIPEGSFDNDTSIWSYFCAARKGWPEAIRRAIAAEAESERLREALIEIAWRGYDERLSAYFYSPENHARCVDIARDVLLK